MTTRKRMPWRLIALGGLVLGVFLASFVVGRAVFQREPAVPVSDVPDGAVLVDPPIALSDFTLTGTDGEPITLSDLRGKPSLVFFGYTHCPDVCPITMAEYADVKRQLGDEGDQVQFVFVSVDGARDTPERVREWLDRFDSSFIGMTGTPEALQPLGQKFGLLYEYVVMENGTAVPLPTGDHTEHAAQAGAENYFVNHTSPSFVVDANGVLQMLYYYGVEAELIADGLRGLIVKRE